MPRVNSTLFLRSGMSQMLRRLCSILDLPDSVRRDAAAPACLTFEDLRLAAQPRDALLRLGAEAMGADGERLGEVAVAEHLHAVEGLLDHPALQEDLRRHDGAGVEDLEGADVDLRELLLEARVGEPALGHAAVQRHLAALEPVMMGEAAAALLPLLSAAGRLAEAA